VKVVGQAYTQWHTVGVVGIVRELLTPSRRWHSDSKRKSFSRWGTRLIKQNDKTENGKSNGQKITTWMIKYPHIKKNAQQYNTHYYPASRPLSTSMYDWLVNIILAILITLCILILVQMGYNFMHGVYS
tara:strand:- start:1394 stop:1780 length:387 start_codon:yes stop_codon:yes gene_type:complete